MEGKPLPDAVRQRESGFPGSEDKVQRSQRTAYASRLRISSTLRQHRGCCNTARFNSDGTRLVTGGDDCQIALWDAWTSELLASMPTGHSANIFCAQFVPTSGDRQVATCAADGEVRLENLPKATESENAERGVRVLGECARLVLKLSFVPESPDCLVTTQMDNTVRLYDTRTCSEQTTLLHLETAQPTSEAVFSPQRSNLFAVATDDLYVSIYDLRMTSHWSVRGPLATYLPAEVKHHANNNVAVGKATEGPSGLAWNENGCLLANYRGADLFLLDASPSGQASGYLDPSEETLQVYRGRENNDTFLKECIFFEEDLVATGSDCGHLFLWNQGTGKLVRKIKGDSVTLNGVDSSESTGALATCGIDSSVKLWWPGEERHPTDGDTGCTDEQSVAGDIPVSFRRRLQANRPVLGEQEAVSAIAEAERRRLGGNERFSEGNISQALNDYDAALSEVNCSPPTTSLLREARRLKLLALLNVAACYVKRQDWEHAKEATTEALSIEPSSVKALYRRAQARFHLNELQEATEDVVKVLQLDSGLREAKRLKQAIEAAEDRSIRKEKAVFSRMFNCGQP